VNAPMVSPQSRDGADGSAKVKRRYTREENDRIAALYQDGIPPLKIAARLGIPYETIKTKITAWGMGGKYRPDCAGPRQ
jgi:hypothetical protein